MFYVIPNSLSDAIYAKLDAEIAKHPEAERDREELYRQLLAYFNEHGVIPDFSLAKRDNLIRPRPCLNRNTLTTASAKP